MRTADAVVAARVDAQHGAAQLQEPLREGVEERRAVEAAAGAMHQAKGVGRQDARRLGRRRQERAVEPDAVASRGLHEIDKHAQLLSLGPAAVDSLWSPLFYVSGEGDPSEKPAIHPLSAKETSVTTGRLGGAITLAALLVLPATTRADDFKPEAGFKRLDNGKDLDGWTGNRAGWSVADGVIHLDSKQAKGHLYSAYVPSGNCIIRLQFRATPRADSGVYIFGKQLQVRDYPTAGPKQYAKPAKPAGEWNDLEFDLTNGVAVVKLNGEVIEPAWETGKETRQGIGLQKETGDFDFRHIRVKEKK
jgi:hypothetical protein